MSNKYIHVLSIIIKYFLEFDNTDNKLIILTTHRSSDVILDIHTAFNDNKLGMTQSTVFI